MQILETLTLIVHVAAAISIIGLVLIQQGRGAEMGAGFGAGSSGTVFGSGGAGNFMTRLTTAIAIVFFVTSFGLAFFAKEKSVSAKTVGIPDVVQQQPAEETGGGQTGTNQSPIPTVQPSDSEIPEVNEETPAAGAGQDDTQSASDESK